MTSPQDSANAVPAPPAKAATTRVRQWPIICVICRSKSNLHEEIKAGKMVVLCDAFDCSDRARERFGRSAW